MSGSRIVSESGTRRRVEVKGHRVGSGVALGMRLDTQVEVPCLTLKWRCLTLVPGTALVTSPSNDPDAMSMVGIGIRI